MLQGVAWVYLAFQEKRSRPGGKARGRGCGPPTDIPEVGTVMGPHILMRGLPTSPNEPAGICSHGKGRGLRPLPEESDSSSASPSSYYSKHSQEVCFRMSGRGSWKRAEFGRVWKSQSVTTSEKRHAEPIAEATRRLPTSLFWGRASSVSHRRH